MSSPVTISGTASVFEGTVKVFEESVASPEESPERELFPVEVPVHLEP